LVKNSALNITEISFQSGSLVSQWNVSVGKWLIKGTRHKEQGTSAASFGRISKIQLDELM
jgi:hypothetical protein